MNMKTIFQQQERAPTSYTVKEFGEMCEAEGKKGVGASGKASAKKRKRSVTPDEKKKR